MKPLLSFCSRLLHRQSSSRYVAALFLVSDVLVCCLFTISSTHFWCLCLHGVQLQTNSYVRHPSEGQEEAPILDSPWATAGLFLTWQW